MHGVNTKHVVVIFSLQHDFMWNLHSYILSMYKYNNLLKWHTRAGSENETKNFDLFERIMCVSEYCDENA